MDHPELDREDWDAFTRFLSLALIAMTRATDTGG